MALDLAASLGLQQFHDVDEAGQPVLDEGESILRVFQRLQLVMGTDADAGEGTVFITQGRVIWLSSAAGRPHGFAVTFPEISMHAVATDAESFNRPCLYLQLDQEEGEQQQQEEDEEGEEGNAEQPLPELRLIPADDATLDDLFKAFCEGAERNPDFSDDDGQGDFYFDRDEALAGATEASLGVAEVAELVGDDPGRFEDAEAVEEDEDDFEEFEGEQGAGQQQQQQNGKHRG